jgi:hypothetical protein
MGIFFGGKGRPVLKADNMEGLLTFKKELKSFLLMHSFYTVNEFISFNKKKTVV